MNMERSIITVLLYCLCMAVVALADEKPLVAQKRRGLYKYVNKDSNVEEASRDDFGFEERLLQVEVSDSMDDGSVKEQGSDSEDSSVATSATEAEPRLARCEPGLANETILPGLPRYCPGEDFVDAYLDAMKAWGASDYQDFAPISRGLYDEEDPNVEFCLNGGCFRGIDEMKASFESTPFFANKTLYNVEIVGWETNPGVLKGTFKEYVTDLCDPPNSYVLNLEAAYYFNENGKLHAGHAFNIPSVEHETFLLNAFTCAYGEF